MLMVWQIKKQNFVGCFVDPWYVMPEGHQRAVHEAMNPDQAVLLVLEFQKVTEAKAWTVVFFAGHDQVNPDRV
jgi:hypothetical protein